MVDPAGKLLGLTVDKLFIGPEEHDLLFEDKYGDRLVRLTAVGDCCSESWFADITGVQALLGQTVTGVETLDMPDAPVDGRCREDHDVQYGFRLTTAKGRCDIVFRNSSNGYYGGYLDGSDDTETDLREQASAYYEWDPATRKTVRVIGELREITDDWSA